MDPSTWKVDLGHGMGPLALGAEREAVLARLSDAGIELEPDDEDPIWLFLPEMGTELTFSVDQPPRLVQIVVEDERIRFGTLPVLGKRIYEIVELLQVPESETLWRMGEDPSLSLPGRDGEQPATATDVELLKSGTLWITTLGLGLSLWRGEVDAVYLRQPQDSPRSGIGPFLPQHAELSRSTKLDEALTGSREKPPRATSWFRTLSRMVLFAALGTVVWQAMRYQQRWSASPVVEGQIVAVKPPPPDPFPKEFTVAYQDQQGGEHQVLFDLSNVNNGRKVGDKVDLRYLPDDPDQAMGVASSRDAAILKFLPWGIGVIVVYMALQFVPMIVGTLFANARVKEE